jgi:hypothetical protein
MNNNKKKKKTTTTLILNQETNILKLSQSIEVVGYFYLNDLFYIVINIIIKEL